MCERRLLAKAKAFISNRKQGVCASKYEKHTY
jgi:hypothetical protein